MTKETHTHRGHCQACGRLQAVDNVTGLVAKHGYTVDWGYFSGTCQASDNKPAEHDVTITNRVIKFCLETAAIHDDSVTNLKNGTTVPSTFERWNSRKAVVTKDKWNREVKRTGGYDTLPIAQASQDERAKVIALAIQEHGMHASGLRMHAHALTTNVLPCLGKPLTAVADIVPAPKPAAPTVDVKAAKVTGTFATKAARKEALEKLSRQYDKLRDVIQSAYLALPTGERTVARTEVYHGPYQLSHWRPKHSMAVLNEFPSLAETVDEIDALVKAREAVKAAP